MKSIGIINYQINNLSSIYYAIENIGYKPIFLDEYISQKFDILIIPGTGSFAHGMKYLRSQKLEKMILDHVHRGGITIAICLGFQLLFKKSNEFEDTKGLGILDGEIVPFMNNCDKPNIGWSKVFLNESINSSSTIHKSLDSKFFYHVHSYYVKNNKSDKILTYSYNKEFKFTSSVCYENVYGFQFHPEKSGINGENLLKSIIKNK